MLLSRRENFSWNSIFLFSIIVLLYLARSMLVFRIDSGCRIWCALRKRTWNRIIQTDLLTQVVREFKQHLLNCSSDFCCLDSRHYFDGRFYLYYYARKAHNYDLYSFSAIYSPNILQFIHNSASCNIPLRWDGTRDITSVSIIYHGTLHTNQLILIVHWYCTGMCLRRNNYLFCFSRTECYYLFFFT